VESAFVQELYYFIDLIAESHLEEPIHEEAMSLLIKLVREPPLSV
jgi:hypothetical protein